jgi:hypothetical protein
MSPKDSDPVSKGQFDGADLGIQGGVMHQRSGGKVRQEEAVQLLADKLGSLLAQHDPRTSQTDLELIEGGLDLSALAVQSGRLLLEDEE